MNTKKTTRRDILKLGLAAGLSVPFAGGLRSFAASASLPEPTYSKLPVWRGFNLLEKFMVPWNNKPFSEDDFRWISDFGFNFVRLPMDYRTWIVDGDWRKFNEQTLKEIDQAVAFGEKYGIHVKINFHRAPGYTVANPPEAKSVWTDSETQDVCALHWTTFANRYKGIPNRRLSFNLFNEPSNVPEKQYYDVHKMLIETIRAIDPDRLIICDGMDWGSKPAMVLRDLKVAQASRGYAPSEISHYGANWVDSANFPTPSWPMRTINGLLPSPNKSETPADSRKPLEIVGPFSSQTKLRLKVASVSAKTKLAVKADDTTIFEHQFDPGPGEGEWKTVVHKPQWNVYQNVYDKNYETIIPKGTKTVRIFAADGDWVSVSEIGLQGENSQKELTVNATAGWGQNSSQLKYDDSKATPTISGGETRDKSWLKRTMIDPWKEAQAAGIGVMIGEFGAHNQTPHDVTLAWLEDSLSNWNEAGWGFALWNFRGSFGIMDSDRKDVAYEDFHGHKLDRKLLQLLQKH